MPFCFRFCAWCLAGLAFKSQSSESNRNSYPIPLSVPDLSPDIPIWASLARSAPGGLDCLGTSDTTPQATDRLFAWLTSSSVGLVRLRRTASALRLLWSQHQLTSSGVRRFWAEQQEAKQPTKVKQVSKQASIAKEQIFCTRQWSRQASHCQHQLAVGHLLVSDLLPERARFILPIRSSIHSVISRRDSFADRAAQRRSR